VQKILVLGIGNILMGDEGVGVRVVESLDPQSMPPGVDIVEGGTGGFQLLALFDQYDQMIIVDASLDGKPPGTLTVLAPKYSAQFPATLTAHDIGLKDLVDAAELLGRVPPIQLVTISVAEFQSVGLALTPDVSAAIPNALEQIRLLLGEATPTVESSAVEKNAPREKREEPSHA